MTIENIKTELREIIELSGKITSAGKFCEGWPEETAIISKVCNLTPKMSKALLMAIISLEALAASEVSADPCEACNHPDDARDTLETIRREWEVQI